MKANEKYWVGGRAGAGKSELCRELVRRGLEAIDSDEVDGLARWIDLSSGQPVELDPSGIIDDTKFDWLWDKARLKDILARPRQILLCGSAGNDTDFFGYFEKVFVLTVDPETQLERLQTRDSLFGKNPEMQTVILEWQKDFVEKMLNLGAIALDANEPVNAVADELLTHLR